MSVSCLPLPVVEVNKVSKYFLECSTCERTMIHRLQEKIHTRKSNNYDA